MLIKFTAVQVLFIAVNAVLNIKAKDEGNIWTFSFLLNAAYLIFFNISLQILINSAYIKRFYIYKDYVMYRLFKLLCFRFYQIFEG